MSAPPFPQPPAWYAPGNALGGSGQGSSGGKGRGGGKGGGKGRGGRRGRYSQSGGGAAQGEAQAYFKPSFLENPWANFFPGEPRVFDLRDASVQNTGSQPAVRCSVGDLPSIGGSSLHEAGLVGGDGAVALSADVADLVTLLQSTEAESHASELAPLVRDLATRCRGVIWTRLGDTVADDEQVPKRSRLSLPPPVNCDGAVASQAGVGTGDAGSLGATNPIFDPLPPPFG